MPINDSAIEPEALAYARGLLKPPLPRDGVWPAVGAMAMFATSALLLAGVMLTTPPPGDALVTKKSITEQSLDPK